MTTQTPVAEGKTKRLFPTQTPSILRVQHKIDITAGDGAKHETMEGKDVAACLTTSNVFRLLTAAGIPNHFIEPVQARQSEGLKPNEMFVRRLEMVKLESVARRVAAGSYLKRNPHVAEGTRFAPLVTELFLKDDSLHDPIIEWDPAVEDWVFWPADQPRNQQAPTFLEETKKATNSKLADRLFPWVIISNLPKMTQLTTDVFEVLERAWASLGIQLVDMKIEFGIDAHSGPEEELLVADVIDNDSWRIWPAGDKRLQLDKQAFREMDEVTVERMAALKQNYDRVAELTGEWLRPGPHKVVILAGSQSDRLWVEKILERLGKLGLNEEVEYYSADKTPEELRAFVASKDASGEQIVYIAVAGRRNALGGIDLHTTNPVINCPPEDTSPFAVPNLISSLEMPSGIGAVTVKYPEAAAIAAAKIIAEKNLLIWCNLRNYQRGIRQAVRVG